MKKIILMIFAILLMFGPMLLIVTPDVYATPPPVLPAPPRPGEPITIEPVPIITVEHALNRIFIFAFWLLLTISGLFFLYGAFSFLIGGQDPEQVKKGKSILTFAIVGIIIAILARGMAEFIPRMFR